MQSGQSAINLTAPSQQSTATTTGESSIAKANRKMEAGSIARLLNPDTSPTTGASAISSASADGSGGVRNNGDSSCSKSDSNSKATATMRGRTRARPKRVRKAPFMEALDELRQNGGGVTGDEKLIFDNYPGLMKAYDEELKAVYTAAEEQCSRILANCTLPDLSNEIYDNGDSSTEIEKEFFHALMKMQRTGRVGHNTKRTALTKQAVARLKQWFLAHKNKPYPTDEEKVALSNETGVSVPQISTWFANARRGMSRIATQK